MTEIQVLDRSSSSDLGFVSKPEPIIAREQSDVNSVNEKEKEAEKEPPILGGLFAGWKTARKELLTSLKLVGPVMVSNVISLANNMINIVCIR